MQPVTPKKFAACLVYRYTYIVKPLVAVHYGSYLRAGRYVYKVVNQPSDLHVFSSNLFIQILYLFVYFHFLEYSVIHSLYNPYSNQFVQLNFVRITASIKIPTGCQCPLSDFYF